MSSKVLLRIAMVLGVALAAWALLAVLRRSAADRTVGVPLPTVSPEQADAISYVGPQDSIRLTLTGGVWQVNGHRASATAVQAFFRALGDTSARSELIAQSTASHERLGVDSLKGKRLTVTGGGQTLLDVWFGNRGPDFEGFYIRRAGDNRVFLLRGAFADLTAQPLDDWRDNQVLAIPADSIGGVAVVRGRRSYSLTRVGGGWSLGSGAAPDSIRVARFLAQFGELRASSFPGTEEADSARFEPADRRVTLYGRGGQTLAALVLDSIASGFLLRVGDSGEVVKLNTRLADGITPDQGTLYR
jgi:hypothetical protein